MRVAARVIGERGTMTAECAPNIPVVSQPVDLAIMLDMVHFLNHDGLKLTLERLYDRIRPGGRLVLRAAVPPKGRTSRAWRLENFRYKLNHIKTCYRPAENIKAILNQADFQVEQIESSGTGEELVWFIASKNLPDEKN